MSGANVEPRRHLVVPSPPQSWGRCGGWVGGPLLLPPPHPEGSEITFECQIQDRYLVYIALFNLFSSPSVSFSED